MKGAPIPYSAAEMAWLETNRSLVISDYHSGFQAAFQRADVTLANLHSLRKRKGWKVGRAKGRTAGRLRVYTEAEMAWLRANCTLPINEYTARFNKTFGRTASAQNLHGLRKRHGWKTGRTGQFAKGNVSHNKGKSCPPGVGGRHPNAQRTQFKKGQLPHNTKFAGHERVNVDGYVEISVEEMNPHTSYERRYVHKHVWLWEKANGPVPKDMCLKCLDGNRLNTDPSNWEAIPRSMLPALAGGRYRRLPGYDQAAPELKPAIMALAKIKHRARELQRKDEAAA